MLTKEIPCTCRMINIRVLVLLHKTGSILFIRIFIILILNETQRPASPPHGLMTPPHTQISDLPKRCVQDF